MSVKSRLMALGLVSLGLYGCGSENASQKSEPIRSVYVTTPQTESSTAVRTFTSAVEEGKSVNASFKTGGQIKRLSFKEGDRVFKGAVLGVLDDVDYKLQFQQVQTQYDQLASELSRLEEMYRRNNIAPNDYEKAKAGLEQLKAQLDLVKRQLAYTRLEAPASGYIVERYMEEGEMTGAGTPVYKILDNSSLETSVSLPASVYAMRGEIASCVGKSMATGDREIPLEIINYVPDGDNNALFRLRLRIPTEYRNRLLPGMNMTVSIRFNKEVGFASAIIPSRAVFEKNGKEYVWVVNRKDSSVRLKEVKRVGMHRGDKSEVLGLDGSEEIVAAGVHHISAGEKVSVAGDIAFIKKEGCHD